MMYVVTHSAGLGLGLTILKELDGKAISRAEALYRTYRYPLPKERRRIK
jgi:hypothetical protein